MAENFKWGTKIHYIFFKSLKGQNQLKDRKGPSTTGHKGHTQLGPQNRKPNPGPKTQGTTQPHREWRILSLEKEDPNQHLQQKSSRRRNLAKKAKRDDGRPKDTRRVRPTCLRSGMWRSKSRCWTAGQGQHNTKGVTSDFVRVFTERVIYIVKDFVDISYESWKFVPLMDKQELYTSVLVANYHYELHEIYKSFLTSEEARQNPPEDLAAQVWIQLCDHWESEAHKKLFRKNALNKTKMALFMNRDPTKSDVDVAKEVFREVLGQRSGYAIGLGKFVMPPPSSKERSSQPHPASG
ncbi:hypothetical protein CJ030_MR6G028231 [Morella rubra]|uniref:Uncharacterized protein n=1 Tax=Morella rubra TaxID=262757 RepID=A0A6A1VEI0_9ROSI|nr:hypothetical protein CJ030_MR6G028231 [Morella rubra]